MMSQILLTAGETAFVLYIDTATRDAMFRRSGCPGILAVTPEIVRTDDALYLQLVPSHAHPDGINSLHAEVSRQRMPKSFIVTGYTVTLAHVNWPELNNYRTVSKLPLQTAMASDGSVLLRLPLPRKREKPEGLREDLLSMLQGK